MPSTHDGGRSALAGYLYQIAGAPGWVAGAHSLSGRSSDSEELTAILELVVDAGQLSIEAYGQDAAVRLTQLGLEATDRYVLAQFKFSRKADLSTIGPKELTKIIRQLELAAERVQRLGGCVTGYALITNRRLGPQARPQHEAMQPALRIVKMRAYEWEGDLKRFAQRFRTVDQEIEGGIDKLIGSLFRRSAEGQDATVTVADLKEAFTGYSGSQPLTSEAVAKHVVHGIENSPVNPRVKTLRRQVLDEISRAASQRALVVLSGKGGCGKTVALWQWAQDLSTGTGPLTAIQLAKAMPRHWVAEEISGWADLPATSGRRAEQPERALKRLRVANPDLSPPILHLGLDGLDEEITTSEREDAISGILVWFWKQDMEAIRAEPPLATIVVTCRNTGDLVSKWLDLEVSGFPYSGEPPRSVDVPDFALEELYQAARLTDQPEVYDRIGRALQLLGNDGPGSPLQASESHVWEFPLTFPVAFAPAPGVDERVLEALKHPAMWGTLLRLVANDRLQVLDGEPEAIKKLVGLFVERFCKKVLHRGQAGGLRQDKLVYVLCQIARHCTDTKRTWLSQGDWVGPACHTNLVTDFRARGLYQEALSGGLVIQKDASQWGWRHNIVLEYLAKANSE